MRTTTIIESVIMTLGQSTVKCFKGIIFQVIAALDSRLFYLSAPLVLMKLGGHFALKAKLFPFFVYFSHLQENGSSSYANVDTSLLNKPRCGDAKHKDKISWVDESLNLLNKGAKLGV